MKILVTGAAGFIGYYATKVLAARGDEVVGLDNINAYYDTRLKYARLAQNGISQDAIVEGQPTASTCYPNYRFIKLDLGNREALQRLFVAERFDRVCNLAAQAGVRYSLKNPYAYADSNVVGFVNLLECCRHHGIGHLVYASSSSVYGLNSKVPFSEDDRTDTPVSLYAATKKANELMAHAYSKLYRLPTTGLRFFTVYGPWGRPDMAPMLFSNAITAGQTIKVFNNGRLSRDFTYIDDIAEGLVRAIDHTPQGKVPYAIYNIGCSQPVQLMDFIQTLETAIGRQAQIRMMPMQAGDVYQTYADTRKIERELGYKPSVPLEKGIEAFIKWYKTENPLQ